MNTTDGVLSVAKIDEKSDNLVIRVYKALEEGYKSIVKTSWNVARLISTK